MNVCQKTALGRAETTDSLFRRCSPEKTCPKPISSGGGDMKTNSRTEKNEEVLLHDTIRVAKWSRTPAFP
ncbi:hypothetical protein OJAV_G00075780 [Oryzias javanicus]|uniref:Uncharacterized protein n=1 Tax=Oryzias javanicus TaxID=123683 RepID=A0A437D3I4_ORYJA|nr:hypothetical protein OJAV_G00075780 [Oryzias javanicus]